MKQPKCIGGGVYHVFFAQPCQTSMAMLRNIRRSKIRGGRAVYILAALLVPDARLPNRAL